MRKLFLIALLVVGTTTFAQRPNGEKNEKLTPEQRVDFQVKKMTKDLNLTDKQAEQIKVLIAKEVEKREAKRSEMKAKKEEQGKPSKEEMEARKAEMKANQDEMKSEMKKILTADQYAKWEQKLEERKDKMIEKMKEKRKEKTKPNEN
jgi:protein CpxP